MKIKLFQVDAFAEKLFMGNPAAVCPLEKWLPDEILQKIAMENNLSETAFFVNENNAFHIRWFTPLTEVDLCGHATLATSHVIFNLLHHENDVIHFFSKSGVLSVRKENEYLILNFPTDKISKIEIPAIIAEGIGMAPVETYKGTSDYMLIYKNQEQIENIKPDFKILSKTGTRGIIVTSKGNECDFVSRFFGPGVGIDEDPVTGSAHTTLIPYWKNVLNKNEMTAIQLSKRKGHLKCKYLGERVEIAGKAKTYLIGEIEIN
ncbi:MAG TPA: PhzF family phenazine biosynthesis protein [Bacteroidales bacterium]|nr:PhzF family phenazine biosynthesis protein [Bacteroidales bacterium]HPS18445.1 PhzF family phenazine biosynthesis protein [Bacteroidales bacterium]